MTSPEPVRGGVLVVRVWFEDGPAEETFRARITSSVDIESETQVVAVVASARDALEEVRGRLAEMIERQRRK